MRSGRNFRYLIWGSRRDYDVASDANPAKNRVSASILDLQFLEREQALRLLLEQVENGADRSRHAEENDARCRAAKSAPSPTANRRAAYVASARTAPLQSRAGAFLRVVPHQAAVSTSGGVCFGGENAACYAPLLRCSVST